MPPKQNFLSRIPPFQLILLILGMFLIILLIPFIAYILDKPTRKTEISSKDSITTPTAIPETKDIPIETSTITAKTTPTPNLSKLAGIKIFDVYGRNLDEITKKYSMPLNGNGSYSSSDDEYKIAIESKDKRTVSYVELYYKKLICKADSSIINDESKILDLAGIDKNKAGDISNRKDVNTVGTVFYKGYKGLVVGYGCNYGYYSAFVYADPLT